MSSEKILIISDTKLKKFSDGQNIPLRHECLEIGSDLRPKNVGIVLRTGVHSRGSHKQLDLTTWFITVSPT